MDKLMKDKIRGLLKGNGWMAEDVMARKLGVSFQEIDRVFGELERDGFIEERIAR